MESGHEDRRGAMRGAPLAPARSGAVLVTGGAGYVGSHVVPALREAGYRVVVLDNLSTGRRAAVPDDVAFVEGDAGDGATAGAVIAGHGIASVVHLAASIDIAESLADPLKYDRNNAFASAALVRACVAGGVGRFVFASSAAVYGQPGAAPVGEDAPAAPVHAYGRSKLATEGLLRETAARHGMRYAVLRYFNVAGADPLGRAGPSGADCHLVTAACRAALGLRDGVTVFGTDYPTPDGTCVRDYIHVSDLAAIHVAALRGLENGAPDRVLNCGSGRGVSVREALAVGAGGSRRRLRRPRRAAPRRRPPGPGRRCRAGARRPALVAASWRPSRHRAKRARLGRSPCRRGPWTAGRGQCLSPGTGCSTRRVSPWPRPARHGPGCARRGAGTSPRVSSAIWSWCSTAPSPRSRGS